MLKNQKSKKEKQQLKRQKSEKENLKQILNPMNNAG